MFSWEILFSYITLTWTLHCSAFHSLPKAFNQPHQCPFPPHALMLQTWIMYLLLTTSPHAPGRIPHPTQRHSWTAGPFLLIPERRHATLPDSQHPYPFLLMEMRNRSLQNPQQVNALGKCTTGLIWNKDFVKRQQSSIPGLFSRRCIAPTSHFLHTTFSCQIQHSYMIVA